MEIEKIDPLAQFILKEDSLNLFETFSTFREVHQNSKTKTSATKEKSLQSNVYFVQVGLTDSFDEISSLKTQISNLFPNEKVTIDYDTPFYRVIIGPFNSRSEANNIFSILERKNFSSLRIRTETSK
ncbi:MAG: SPOR domain-containing protein [Ignavibacteria bacterium]